MSYLRARSPGPTRTRETWLLTSSRFPAEGTALAGQPQQPQQPQPSQTPQAGHGQVNSQASAPTAATPTPCSEQV